MTDSDPYLTPEGRDPFGLAHQLRTTISLALFVATKPHVRKNSEIVMHASREELLERVMLYVRRQFTVTWPGSTDTSDDARQPDPYS